MICKFLKIKKEDKEKVDSKDYNTRKANLRRGAGYGNLGGLDINAGGGAFSTFH